MFRNTNPFDKKSIFECKDTSRPFASKQSLQEKTIELSGDPKLEILKQRYYSENPEKYLNNQRSHQYGKIPIWVWVLAGAALVKIFK